MLCHDGPLRFMPANVCLQSDALPCVRLLPGQQDAHPGMQIVLQLAAELQALSQRCLSSCHLRTPISHLRDLGFLLLCSFLQLLQPLRALAQCQSSLCALRKCARSAAGLESGEHRCTCLPAHAAAHGLRSRLMLQTKAVQTCLYLDWAPAVLPEFDRFISARGDARVQTWVRARCALC